MAHLTAERVACDRRPRLPHLHHRMIRGEGDGQKEKRSEDAWIGGPWRRPARDANARLVPRCLASCALGCHTRAFCASAPAAAQSLFPRGSLHWARAPTDAPLCQNHTAPTPVTYMPSHGSGPSVRLLQRHAAETRCACNVHVCARATSYRGRRTSGAAVWSSDVCLSACASAHTRSALVSPARPPTTHPRWMAPPQTHRLPAQQQPATSACQTPRSIPRASAVTWGEVGGGGGTSRWRYFRPCSTVRLLSSSSTDCRCRCRASSANCSRSFSRCSCCFFLAICVGTQVRQ